MALRILRFGVDPGRSFQFFSFAARLLRLHPKTRSEYEMAMAEHLPNTDTHCGELQNYYIKRDKIM